MNADWKSIIRQLFVYAIATLAMVVIMLRTNVVEKLSYSIEKGRIQAARDAMPSQDEVATINAPSRNVAMVVAPAVVAITTERNFDLARHLGIELAPADSNGLPANTNAMASSNGMADSNGMINSNSVVMPHGWMERLFGGRPRSLPAEVGSGFIVDAKNGYIVTNNHVIADADLVRVQLSDGRQMVASVLGADPKSDLAVIKIDADEIHSVSFADSGLVEVGDLVMAVGNPFGLSGTFSQGIISGKGRSNVQIHGAEYRGFLQTDAVINPGNSGGPLVNMRGEVIGVNTAIATQSGHYDGVGFAIPSSRVMQVLPALIEGKKVQRGYLGVAIFDVTADKETAESLGWHSHYGVIVNQIMEGAAAERDGVKLKDIVLEIDGQKLRGNADLIDIIGATNPGDTVDLLIWRDGKEITLPVKVDAQPKGFSTRIRVPVVPRSD